MRTLIHSSIVLATGLFACGAEPTGTSEPSPNSAIDQALGVSPTDGVVKYRDGSLLNLQGFGDLAVANALLQSEGITQYEALNANGFALMGLEGTHYRHSSVGPNGDGVGFMFVTKVGDTSGALGIYWFGRQVSFNPGEIYLGHTVFGTHYVRGHVKLLPGGDAPTSVEVSTENADVFSLKFGASTLPATTSPLNIDSFEITDTKSFRIVLTSPASLTRPFDPTVDSFSFDATSEIGKVLTNAHWAPFQWQQIASDLDIDVYIP